MIRFGEKLVELRRLLFAERGIGVVQVRGDEGNRFAVHGDANFVRDPLFPVRHAGQKVNRLFADFRFRKNRLPVIAAVVGNLFAECAVHAGELRQFGKLIDVPRPFHLLVHFLQGNEIGLRGLDDIRQPRQIDFPVGPLAVVNVVRQHADGLAFGGRLGGSAEQNGKSE